MPNGVFFSQSESLPSINYSKINYALIKAIETFNEDYNYNSLNCTFFDCSAAFIEACREANYASNSIVMSFDASLFSARAPHEDLRRKKCLFRLNSIDLDFLIDGWACIKSILHICSILEPFFAYLPRCEHAIYENYLETLRINYDSVFWNRYCMYLRIVGACLLNLDYATLSRQEDLSLLIGLSGKMLNFYLNAYLSLEIRVWALEMQELGGHRDLLEILLKEIERLEMVQAQKHSYKYSAAEESVHQALLYVEEQQEEEPLRLNDEECLEKAPSAANFNATSDASLPTPLKQLRS